MKEFEIVRELLPKLNCEAETIERFLGVLSNILNEYRDVILNTEKWYIRDIDCLGFRGFATNSDTRQMNVKLSVGYITFNSWDNYNSIYLTRNIEFPLDYLCDEDILINIRQKKEGEKK